MKNNKKDIIMETEYEAKFYPVDKGEIRKKLNMVGAKLITPERKMRRSIVDGRVNHQFRCHYIRVRDEGNMITMSAKVHAKKAGKVSDQKETVIEVSNYDDAVTILRLMGFEIDIYQETLRETWELDVAEVVIDTWPGLETYVEIEAKSEKDVKAAADRLDLDWENKTVTSIVEVYGDVYGLTNDDVHKNIAYLTFKNNPFENLNKSK